MKKTLTLLLAAVAAFSMTAANFFTVDEADMGTPVKMENVKKAPAGMQELMMEKFAAKLKATPNFPVTNAPDDLVGGYDWAYRQYTGGFTTQPDTISNDYTFQRDTEDNVDLIGMNKISDTQIRLTGFMPLPVTATMGTSGDYTTFTIDEGQTVYTHSSYGACTVKGVWYYEGDDTYSAGWYYGDIMGYILDQGIIMDPDINFYIVIQSGTYANYRLGWIYEPGSVMVPDENFNGLMSFDYSSATWDWPVVVSEDNSTYVVSVDNFAGIGTTPATFNLEEGNTWTADQSVFYVYGDNNYALYGYDGNNLTDLTGTGTEKVLTFGSDWTGCDNETGYWIGQRSNTTITLISDDEFVYPTPAPEHAYYLIGAFNGWDQNNMVPFVEEDGVYTLTYNFGGEFKVKDENGNWWGGGVTLTEDNPSVTLVDGGNLNLNQVAEYTLTIENGVLTVTGFPEPVVPEYSEFYVVGTFNSWNQNEDGGRVALVDNGSNEYTGTVEFEANAEFKIITPVEYGWKWFGGAEGACLINDDVLNTNIALVDGSNFQVADGGSYDITVKAAPAEGKAVQEPLVMVITKTPTAISTVGVDKVDNRIFDIMGRELKSIPETGIYIQNGKKYVK